LDKGWSMRNTLLLRKDPANAAAWCWLSLDNEGRPQGSIYTGTLADAASEASGQRVVVLVSGAAGLLTRVSIPVRGRQRLLRAVPYALEEQLSEEVDNLHFAVGTTQEDGAWPVAVFSKQFMDSLTADFLEAGLDVQQVIPEILALPNNGEETSVLVENDVALVRTGKSSGFAVDSDNLGIMLAARMTDEEAGLQPLHLFVSKDELRPDMAEYVGETLVEPFAGDPLNVFARGLENGSINLLQGAYSRSGNWATLLRPWRATAALLLAGIILSNVVMGIDYFRLSRESEQLHAQIEKTFREALPEIQRIVNPRIQMQQRLDALQRRHAILRRGLRGRNIRLNYHGAQDTLLEAVIARGDRRLGSVIERAWRAMSRCTNVSAGESNSRSCSPMQTLPSLTTAYLCGQMSPISSSEKPSVL